MNKKTVILGATTNTSRYAHLAAEMLDEYDYDFIPLGFKKGDVLGRPILDLRHHPQLTDIDTVTVYLNQYNQKEWEEYILSLSPRRIIFNPGAENQELATIANNRGIEAINACTLVMLRIGEY